jgi:replicative DNA helicase
MDALARTIEKAKLEALICDPLYLGLLSGQGAKNLSASNLYDVGPLLLRVTRACLDAGATPLLVHHTVKRLEEPYEPLTLTDLAFAGVAEFVRQWVIINRREPFESGTGLHKLWVNIGGSTGQNELLSLDVDEGRLDLNFGGRQWELDVKVGQQARTAARDARDQRKEENAKRRADADDIAVLQAIDKVAGPDGAAVARQVRLACQWGHARWADSAAGGKSGGRGRRRPSWRSA